jgi:hypothetical protein
VNREAEIYQWKKWLLTLYVHAAEDISDASVVYINVLFLKNTALTISQYLNVAVSLREEWPQYLVACLQLHQCVIPVTNGSVALALH